MVGQWSGLLLPACTSLSAVGVPSDSGKNFFLLQARISGSCVSTDLKLFLGLSPFSPNRATQTWFKTIRICYLGVLEIISLARLKSRCQQGWVSLEVPGENPFPCLFSLFEVVQTPWLTAPTSIFKAHHSNLWFCPPISSFYL